MTDPKQQDVHLDSATVVALFSKLGEISGQLKAMEEHNKEWRDKQAINDKAVWDKLDTHDKRIRHNETNIAKKAGLISAATGVGIALIAEAAKRSWLG